MTKKRNMTHGIAIVAICLFAVLAIGSLGSIPKVAQEATIVEEAGEDKIISSVTTSYGVVHNMQNPINSGNMPYAQLKPYRALGIVFATSTTSFDEDGFEFASQEGITILLLREAQKLNADDILNLRVSENITWVESDVDNNDGTFTKVRTKTVTITGSAMAIKYLD